MLDIISYLMGLIKGKPHVILEGDGYSYTDSNSDGNIEITEVNNNG